MPSRFTLPHIDITHFATSRIYVGPSSPVGGGVRERVEHGQRIQNELNAALRLAEEFRPTDDRLERPIGTFLEVELRRGTKPDALDQESKGIRSGGAKVNTQNDRTIALYIPDTARPVLERILAEYLNAPLTAAGNPRHKAKVEAIEAFRRARLETFWTDDPEEIPTDPQHQMWWALWCWTGSEATIEDICARLQLRVAEEDRRLHFPEVVVIPVLATRAAIELMLFSTNVIAELRRASDTPVFFTDDVRGDQQPWVDSLAERTVWPPGDAPAVCIFDTGVNRGHALIEPALAVGDMQAVDRAWGGDDHDVDGHGTAMAGMALHGDLSAALSDQSERRLRHRLESVKILPPNGFDPTLPQSYGPLTQAAVALPEITAPDRMRVYCMAITNEDVSGATPSAWSAAVDQAAAGTMIGDDSDHPPKRLIIVSGGNVPAHVDVSRIRSQDEYPIEDPAQAWNAVTVGGYTELTTVQGQGYEDWTPIAATGELSPHSRTSTTWPQYAPFKPELVMEAGNRAINPARTEAVTLESLSLLTTGRQAEMPLVSFEATSAAAALAARLAARISADHPEFWPETIRGLMVHSAEWTQAMLAMFGARPGKRERYELIRRFGYGVPDYERATASANNHLALFAQSEIQPFRTENGRKFGDCHYYSLPIPPRMLETLENESVELKITLSYFIDPNPGLSANLDPQRYQSHGLRFDLRRKNESVDDFKRRVNVSERPNPRAAPRTEPDDDRWMLGPQSISAGSLHCDVWSGPAIELLGRDMLCIKPVVGWNRERASLEVCNARRRYSLIVSLKSQNATIDLYTPIRTFIGIDVEVPVTIT